MYIYPDNLSAKATLWLWELRDIGIIGVGLLLSVLALTQTGIALPLVLTAVFAFLTIRHEGTSILDFIRYAAAFLLTKQQYYGDQFKEILDEQTALKELRATILAESKEHAEADRRIRDAAGMLENAVPHITEWDESAVRQLVAQVKVLSKNEISVTLKSGIEIRQGISD